MSHPIGTFLKFDWQVIDGRDGVEWFIVDRNSRKGSDDAGAWGPCIISCGVDNVGQTYNLVDHRGIVVPEDEVPDEVWAALAKYRLGFVNEGSQDGAD